MQSQATRWWFLRRLGAHPSSSSSSSFSTSSSSKLVPLAQKINGLATTSERPSLPRQTAAALRAPSPRVTIPALSFSTTPIFGGNSKKKRLPPKPKPPPEEEFTEQFVRGWGPGGQKTNKTSSAVQLKHIPTGTIVKCFETRSREQNRAIARQILAEKLDLIKNKEQSFVAVKSKYAAAKKARAHRKAHKKHLEAAAKRGAGADEGAHYEDHDGGLIDVEKGEHRREAKMDGEEAGLADTPGVSRPTLRDFVRVVLTKRRQWITSIVRRDH